MHSRHRITFKLARRAEEELQQQGESDSDRVYSQPQASEDGGCLTAVLHGPEDTPYQGGHFRVQVRLPETGFPTTPPKAYFVTKVFHPNVSTSTGEICVSSLQKDWKGVLVFSELLRQLRCLLIVPFPESALNQEAARLFMEDYRGAFWKRAVLLTNLHARKKQQENDGTGDTRVSGKEATEETATETQKTHTSAPLGSSASFEEERKQVVGVSSSSSVKTSQGRATKAALRRL